MAVKLARVGTVNRLPAVPGRTGARKVNAAKGTRRKVPLLIAQAPKQGRVAPLQHLRAWRGPGSCSSSRW
jgi:hypothetical protein